ncbi:MAG TPA: NAD(P)-dependent oxidoreductase [Gaiellaceae bacterium]|nr:NAD(P)-dependent oxidoreductase [Gaiellaceae bacterium]
MSESALVGVVGVGAIGGPISRALLDSGYDVAVYDRDREAVARAVAAGAKACASSRALADLAPSVFMSLPAPDAVREVVKGEDGLLGGTAVKTLVDLSTVGAAVAEETALAAQQAGIDYLDAPVSGGVAGAEARTLAVMASGDPGVLEQVRPLLETFGGSVFHVGSEPGQGQLAKLLNNLLSATAVAITSEAVVFGVQAGLDPAVLLEVFSAGSGRNTATTDKFPKHVLTRRFASGFRLALMAKDVELCMAEARRRQLPLLVGGLVQQLWTLAAARSEPDADHTEFVRLFESWSGAVVGGSVGAVDE